MENGYHEVTASTPQQSSSSISNGHQQSNGHSEQLNGTTKSPFNGKNLVVLSSDDDEVPLSKLRINTSSDKENSFQKKKKKKHKEKSPSKSGGSTSKSNSPNKTHSTSHSKEAKSSSSSPSKTTNSQKNKSSSSSSSPSKQNGSSSKKRNPEPSSDDEDTPLSQLKPKLKKRRLIETSEIKKKKKQSTLLEWAKKGKSTSTEKKKEKETKPKEQPKPSKPKTPKKKREPQLAIKCAHLLKKIKKKQDKNEKSPKPEFEVEITRFKKQYGSNIRKLVKDCKEKQLENISHPQVIADVKIRQEKVRIEAMEPEERQQYLAEKRNQASKARLEKRAQEKEALKANMMDDTQLIEKLGSLTYKSLRRIDSAKTDDRFLEKYLKLSRIYCHLFPDILSSYQFISCYASYLSVPGLKATDIRKMSIIDFIKALTHSDEEEEILLTRLIYALIRTKLSKKNTDIGLLTDFGLDIADIGVQKNKLNPTLFCWLLYNYLQNRYESIRSHEKAKFERSLLETSKQGSEMSDNEGPDNSDYGSEVAEETEEDDYESAKYQIAVGTLDMSQKNFFLLEPEEKLQIIKLLIQEHLASQELRDFQEYYEENLRSSKRQLKEDKIYLNQLNSELQELNSGPGDAEAKQNGETVSDKPTVPVTQHYRSSRIEEAKQAKIRDKKNREIELVTADIDSMESLIKEMEYNIEFVYRVESIGSDRHRRTHYIFENLPIIIEEPTNIMLTGEVLHTRWFYISSCKEYLDQAQNSVSEFGEQSERALKEGILKKYKSKIQENYRVYHETLKEEENPEEPAEKEEMEVERERHKSETPQSVVMKQFGTFLEKISKNNQVKLESCCKAEMYCDTPLEQIQIEMASESFSVIDLLQKLLLHFYVKCLQPPLLEQHYRDPWNSLCEKLKQKELCNADLSFLIFVLEQSVNHSQIRRGRRAVEADLTLEKWLEKKEQEKLEKLEEEEKQVEEEEEMEDEEEEESDESSEPAITTASGRRIKTAVNYCEEDEPAVSSRRQRQTSGVRSSMRQAVAKSKENTTSSTRNSRKKSKAKQQPAEDAATRRSSRATSRKCYNDDSSDEEEEESEDEDGDEIEIPTRRTSRRR